jgi:glutathione synthase/RimK-type ligase-like ATP-grasp enzyme
MRLCVFGRQEDPITAHTVARARARGHAVLRVARGQLSEGLPVAFHAGQWIANGEELESYDAFVLRQYPAPTALLAPPEATDTAAGWYRRSVIHGERSAFAQSLLMDLERRGKPFVNPLLQSLPFDHKALQLATFEREGIPLPRTLISNFPDAVRAFVDDTRTGGGEVICKPTAGGAEARAVDDALLARLDDIKDAPVIFQERIHGPDVRATVVGDRVVSCVLIDSDTLDYRSGAAYQRGEARYTQHALPIDIEALCVRAARLCHHVLSGVDLKRCADGSYVVLEANSAPVYLDIEQKTGALITDAVLDQQPR